jgi:hypothetical protein
MELHKESLTIGHNTYSKPDVFVDHYSLDILINRTIDRMH